MANAFVIEINGKAADIVVEERGGFRFFASHRIFWKLDGQVYRRVRDAEKAARGLWGSYLGEAAGKSGQGKAERPERPHYQVVA